MVEVVCVNFPSKKPAPRLLQRLMYDADLALNSTASMAQDKRARAKWAGLVSPYLGDLYSVLRSDWRQKPHHGRDLVFQMLKDY